MEVKGEADNCVIIVVDFDICDSTYKLEKNQRRYQYE